MDRELARLEDITKDPPNPNPTNPNEPPRAAWNFLSWFRSRNPKESEEQSPSVREAIQKEELEALKKKGDMIAAVQRRERETAEGGKGGLLPASPVKSPKAGSPANPRSPASGPAALTVKSSGLYPGLLPASPPNDPLSSASPPPPDRRPSTPQAQTVTTPTSAPPKPFEPPPIDEKMEIATQTTEEGNFRDDRAGSIIEEGLTATDIEDFDFGELATQLQANSDMGQVRLSLCGHRLGRSMQHNREVFKQNQVTYENL